MQDFRKPYTGIRHFGIWATTNADVFSTRDALAILADAAGRCIDDDMRDSRDVLDALNFLSDMSIRKGHADRYRRALNMQEPAIRFRAVADAYQALSRSVCPELVNHTK